MKRKFSQVFIILVVIALDAINLFAQTKAAIPQSSRTEKERVEAERLWEQIIETKGGRKKLHSVANLVLTQGDKPDNLGLGVFFNVFPDKSWKWKKGPPSPKTVWVHMTNLDYGVSLVGSNEGLLSNDKVTKERHNLIVMEYLKDSCIYLLETKWLQPKPIRYERKKIGEEQLDIVETRLFDSTIRLDERMDFVVEPETLLVRWVVNYYKGKPLNHYYFDGYTNVDGIQMPLRYGNLRSFTDKKYFMPLNFQFNVEYDKELFEKPPSVEAGSEAWKPKNKFQPKP